MNCTIQEVKDRIVNLFNVQEPFIVKVATTQDSVAVQSDAQWSEVVKKIYPGLVHIQISTDVTEIPENNVKQNVKLITPKTPCKIILKRKLEEGDGIIVSGRVQSMPFEDLHWSFSLCNSVNCKNSPLVIELIRKANEIGYVNYKYKLNGEMKSHSTPISSPFPFTTDILFQFTVTCHSNHTFSVRFNEERCNVSRIPLLSQYFSLSEMNTVILSATDGRVISDLVLHGYALLDN